TSGLARQFWLMKEKRRCSILFHLLVPGGRWLTMMSMPNSLASFCSSRFHSRRRPEQPGSGYSLPRDRAGYCAGALCRFWSDPGSREAVRTAWPEPWGRDTAAMDDRDRPWFGEKTRLKRV